MCACCACCGGGWHISSPQQPVAGSQRMALPLLRLMGRERTANALLALIMMLLCLWCE